MQQKSLRHTLKESHANRGRFDGGSDLSEGFRDTAPDTALNIEVVRVRVIGLCVQRISWIKIQTKQRLNSEQQALRTSQPTGHVFTK